MTQEQGQRRKQLDKDRETDLSDIEDMCLDRSVGIKGLTYGGSVYDIGTGKQKKTTGQGQRN